MYSADLIKMLDENYPEIILNPSMKPEEIWYTAGQRNLVRNLVTKLKQQEEDALEKELID